MILNFPVLKGDLKLNKKHIFQNTLNRNIFRKNVKSRSFFPACAFVELQCNFIVIIYEEMALLKGPGRRLLSDSLAGWQINPQRMVPAIRWSLWSSKTKLSLCSW
jgi:hypothetical protein